MKNSKGFKDIKRFFVLVLMGIVLGGLFGYGYNAYAGYNQINNQYKIVYNTNHKNKKNTNDYQAIDHYINQKWAKKLQKNHIKQIRITSKGQNNKAIKVPCSKKVVNCFELNFKLDSQNDPFSKKVQSSYTIKPVFFQINNQPKKAVVQILEQYNKKKNASIVPHPMYYPGYFDNLEIKQKESQNKNGKKTGKKNNDQYQAEFSNVQGLKKNWSLSKTKKVVDRIMKHSIKVNKYLNQYYKKHKKSGNSWKQLDKYYF